MAVPWGLLVLVIGLVYGAVKPGRQNKGALFRSGLWIGILVAIVLALVGALTGFSALGLALDFIGLVLTAVILSVLFIVGVWIGDLLTNSRRQTI